MFFAILSCLKFSRGLASDAGCDVQLFDIFKPSVLGIRTLFLIGIHFGMN